MSHENHNPNMTDQELDQVLQLATSPTLVLGAKGRLLTAIAQENRMLNSSSRPQESSRLGWFTAVPLAASLLLGLYVGNAGIDSNMLPSFAQEILADTTLDDISSGIDDVEALTKDSTT